MNHVITCVEGVIGNMQGLVKKFGEVRNDRTISAAARLQADKAIQAAEPMIEQFKQALEVLSGRAAIQPEWMGGGFIRYASEPVTPVDELIAEAQQRGDYLVHAEYTPCDSGESTILTPGAGL